MAVDTREKRQSALNYSRFMTVSMPTANSVIDVFDRAQLWGAYSGLQPASIAIGPFCLDASGKWQAGEVTNGDWTAGYTAIGKWSSGHVTSDEWTASALTNDKWTAGSVANDVSCN